MQCFVGFRELPRGRSWRTFRKHFMQFNGDIPSSISWRVVMDAHGKFHERLHYMS